MSGVFCSGGSWWFGREGCPWGGFARTAMARGILGVPSGRDEYPIANLRVIWGFICGGYYFWDYVASRINYS